MANVSDKAVQIMQSNPDFVLKAVDNSALVRLVVRYEKEIGLSASQVAIKYGLNTETVRSIFKRCNMNRDNVDI